MQFLVSYSIDIILFSSNQKRSVRVADNTKIDPDISLALMVYSALSECLARERCAKGL